MAGRTAPASGNADATGNNGAGRKPKDLWDKLQASGTIVVAIVVALMGGWFNHQQAERNRLSTETQFYTDLLAQRERSDSELRTEMFKTLFEAYFRGRLTTAGTAGTATTASPGPGAEPAMVVAAGPHEDDGPDFAALEQRILFLDLLVRNFENIDIRPLFEDLDRRLTDIVWSGDRGAGGAGAAERRAFGLRWELRRAALGNGVREVSALAGLEGARVQRLGITNGACGTGPAAGESGDIDDPRVYPFGTILINDLDDGRVSLSLMLADGEDAADGVGQPRRLDFQVTFFDMPVLENIRLPTGERLAVTLESYFAPLEYDAFVADIPERAVRLDYRSILDDPALRHCRKATLSLLTFPDGYIGPRDRPYIQNLINPER